MSQPTTVTPLRGRTGVTGNTSPDTFFKHSADTSGWNWLCPAAASTRPALGADAPATSPSSGV